MLLDRIRELGPGLVKDSSKSFLINARTERQHQLYDDPTWVDEDFRAAATSRGVVGLAKALIGTDQVRFFRATCFEKPPYLPFGRPAARSRAVSRLRMTDLPGIGPSVRVPEDGRG